LITHTIRDGAIFRESTTSNQKVLITALSQKDWLKVKEVAHQIKGSGSSFGFPMLTEKAKEVCDAYDSEQLDQITGLTEILIAELDKAIT
jgi:HPt (histidine-containing phosphotransfer) domain-containing protein